MPLGVLDNKKFWSTDFSKLQIISIRLSLSDYIKVTQTFYARLLIKLSVASIFEQCFSILGIFPRGENSKDNRRQVNEKANAIFKNLADGEYVHYLDIGEKFLEDDGTLSRKIMPDLLHLSVEGYTIWAESIEPTLKKLMQD